jgi:hypothetical protein
MEGEGLYAYGFRYYDPVIGRFTGVDPIAEQFAFVSGFNYAENSPIANIDLHGLQSFSTISGAHMAEALYPERAKGVGKAAMKYELYSGAGTITGIVAFLGLGQAPNAMRAILASPTLASTLGGFLWGLGTDQNVPGFGDEISKTGRHAVKSLVESTDNVLDDAVRKLVPYNNDTDVITLFRGTTGSEKSSSQIFLTPNIEYAESYILNGGEIFEYKVSRMGLQKLEWDNVVLPLYGVNSKNGAQGPEYQFSGKKFVDYLNDIGKPVNEKK